jgi:hypothetical protein
MVIRRTLEYLVIILLVIYRLYSYLLFWFFCFKHHKLQVCIYLLLIWFFFWGKVSHCGAQSVLEVAMYSPGWLGAGLEFMILLALLCKWLQVCTTMAQLELDVLYSACLGFIPLHPSKKKNIKMFLYWRSIDDILFKFLYLFYPLHNHSKADILGI